MAEDDVRQRLAAILAADVAGFSRLMGDDERATIAILDEYRGVFRIHIEANGGRVVDMAGDSVLAVFDSATGAVKAAVDAQGELAKRNEGLPDLRVMQFRVGVNLGDVQEKADGTVYGDGVNVAARLEAMANPGGINISGSVFDSVRSKLGLGMDFLGEHEVKNIADPVRAYRVLGEGETAAPAPRRHGRAKVAGLAVAVLFIAGLGGWWMQTGGGEDTTTAEPDPALTLPTGPKIAVIPFTNLSGDPEEEYFSDGLTEDIINRLTNFPNMLVYPRNATRKYKGELVNAANVGAELGATYVVEGSVRRSEDHLRVTVQVLDAGDGTNIWAKTYDRTLTAASVFEVQDDITEGIVNALGAYSGVVARAEWEKSRGKPPNDLTAMECGYLLSAFYDGPTVEKHSIVRDCLEAAVDDNPDFAPARAWLGWAYLEEVRFGFNPRPDSLDRALATAQRAVEMAPNLMQAHQIEALVRFARGEKEAFQISAKRALELAPHNATILAEIGGYTVWSGELERGAALVEKAIKIDPHHPPWYHYSLSHYYLEKEDYEKALDHALRLTWDWSYDFLYRITIYVRTGRMNEARAEAEKLLKLYPTYGEDMRDEIGSYFPEEVIEAYVESLREAGIDIPDEPSLTN